MQYLPGGSDDNLLADFAAKANQVKTAEEQSFFNALTARRLETMGPQDVSADLLAPQELVSFVMRSLSTSAGQGARVMLGFSAVPHPSWHLEDGRGQLQPGAFSDAGALHEFLSGQVRYTTLTRLHEWECVGPVELSSVGQKAVQRCNVRDEQGAAWETLTINMQRGEDVAIGVPRWLITSIFKPAGPSRIGVSKADALRWKERAEDPTRRRVPCAADRPGRAPQFAKGGKLGQESMPVFQSVPGFTFYSNEPATLFIKPPLGAEVVGVGPVERGRNLPGTSTIAFTPANPSARLDAGIREEGYVGYEMEAEGWGRTRCQVRFSDNTTALTHLYVLPPPEN